MTTYIKRSIRFDVNLQPKKNFLCRNERETTAKSNSGVRKVYLNLHEMEIGTTVNFRVPIDINDIEKIKKAIRKEISDYSVYVGIYCNTKFHYDDYHKALNYSVTHDGIRYE